MVGYLKNIHFKIISVTPNQRLFCQAFDISCQQQASVGPGNAKNTRSVIDILTAIRTALEELKSNIIPDPRILQLAITTGFTFSITVIESSDRKCALNRRKASCVIIRIMTHHHNINEGNPLPSKFRNDYCLPETEISVPRPCVKQQYMVSGIDGRRQTLANVK